MPKWSLREKIKDTYLEHCNVSGFIKFNFDGSRPKNAVKIPLKEKAERSELEFQRCWWNILDIPNIEKYFIKKQKGKTVRRLQDWLLIIPQNWSYIIDYMVEVYHQSWWNLETMAKLYTELTLYDEKGSLVGELDRSAKYTITAPDYLWWTTIQSLQKWMKIWVWCKQKVKDNCAMRGVINIVKLS